MSVRLLSKAPRPKDADVEFATVMKAMRKELAQRKNTIKASSWLSLMSTSPGFIAEDEVDTQSEHRE
ncbi:hypothetical protein HPB52_025323 [Rhipicephalus sanguineus]|uniref:Uncharacterized protein n=1 Tax=Rhipicephalus sanguineus TaxID=34632 RepID=A0A9D4YRI9_RHISA|nr:hypothetical protein HPB52_025323 [Rhipicephalus sanguineus]